MTSSARTINETLRDLHLAHQQAEQLRARLSRGPRIQAAFKKKIQEAQQALEAVREAHRKLESAVREKQGQYDQNLATIQRRKGQLMEAKSNREYQMLKDQIAADEMANSVLADEIIDLMTRAEEKAEEVKEAEKALAAVQAEAEKAAKTFAEEAPTIEADLQRVEERIRALEEALPARPEHERANEQREGVRQLYRRALASMGAQALAEVRNGVCSGCNQRIPLNQLNNLLLGHTSCCRACGRVLYPEETTGNSPSD
ncbi:phospholipase [Thermostilla marina]